MFKSSLVNLLSWVLILGAGIVAATDGIRAAGGSRGERSQKQQHRRQTAAEQSLARTGTRHDVAGRHRLEPRGQVPNQWRLREVLPAPLTDYDPEAPVVDVEREANRTLLLDGELDPTPDVQITEEIVDKAAELGTARAMYEFVRDEIRFQAYYGSQKGSVETLRQGTGNDYDQASLLIALLRASSIPARYAEGQVEMTVEQATNWLAVDDGQVAGSILYTNGLEGVSVVSASTDCCYGNGTPGCDDPAIEACVCAIDPYCCSTQWDQQCADEVDSFGCAVCDDLTDVVAVRARRVWVEAFVPRGFGSPTWVTLDPAFHRNDILQGIDIPHEMGLSAQAFVDDYWDPSDPDVTLPRSATPLDVLEQRIQEYLDSNHPGLTVEDVKRTPEAIAQRLGLLPASLPYTVRSRDGVFTEVPADRRYRIRFHLYQGGTTFIDHTLNLPETAGRRITVSYEGATQADKDTIQSYHGLLYTPPNLINVRALLKVNGQTVATGAAAIGAGRTHDSDLHFLAPVNSQGLPQNVVPAIYNTIVAGEFQAIGLAVHGASSPLTAPADPVDAEGYIARQRHADAMDYLGRGYAATAELGRIFHSFIAFDVDDAIVKDEILVTTDGFGNPTGWEWRGLTVDADRSVIGVWKVDEYESGCGGEGRELLIVGGAEGSAAEHYLFEDDYEQAAVSTMKILQLAVDQGITVYKRWDSLPLPANTLPVATRVAIENAIAAGHEVTFPADPIAYSEWTGTGYIDMDPCDGAAGYIISGGYNGGSTVDSWTDILWADADCTVEWVEGRVNDPAQDSPDPGAVFCSRDTENLNFRYDLRIRYIVTEDCPDQYGSWESRSHRSKSPSQLPPAHYQLIVGDHGDPADDQHMRQLTVYKVEIERPTGDPRSSPAPSTSEFTFSGGNLSIECKAKLTPDDAGIRAALEDHVKWTSTDIGGSSLSWTVPWPSDPRAGKGFETTAQFSGLPPDNNAFGDKVVTMTVTDPASQATCTTETTNVQVFFPKDSGSPPNWFTYWSQVLRGLGSTTVTYNTCNANGMVPAGRYWSPTMTYSKTEIWICPHSAISNTSPYNPGTRYGIDAMADTILHENGHTVQIANADALVNTGSGIWAKGWSWLTGYPHAWYNHYTAGPDGKPGAAGVDDDSDGTTDETDDNSEYGFGDDVDLDTDHDDIPNAYEGESPAWLEPYCQNLEQTQDNDHASADWGAPGKQHKTNNKYND